MKTRLILVRHAEAEGNANRLFHGWTDSNITDKGHMQAERLAIRLEKVKIDKIFSSSLKRAVQTAEYVAGVKKLPIIETDVLKEINGGEWENCSWIDLMKKWPESYSVWENKPHLHRMPNGESMAELFHRIVDILMDIISSNKGKSICAVTHGTALKALMCHIRGSSLDTMLEVPWYENASITIIEYDDRFGRFDIITEGDYSHLGKELCTIQNQDWWTDILDRGGGKADG